MSRTIIQIAATASAGDSGRRESLYALDSDGKVWIINAYEDGANWIELPELPPKPKGASMLDAL